MSDKKSKSYYGILGVDPKASDDEIKNAFRKLARQYHPDVSKEPDAEDKFKEINEAYGVLSNSRKRNEYDSLGKQSSRDIKKDSDFYWDEHGGLRMKPEKVKDHFSFLFDIGGEKLFSEQWTPEFATSGDFFDGHHDPETGLVVKEIAKVPREIYLPDNDFGLIHALVKAYSSHDDIELTVKPSTNDKRKWMTDSLYIIEKKGEKVSVSRTIKDWRYESDREKSIFLKDENKPYLPGKEIDGEEFFGEYYLNNNADNKFYGEGGTSPIPPGYGKYLAALKSYAKKISYGLTDYNRELETISKYSKGRTRNANVEGRSYLPIKESYEWIRKYNIEYLPAFVKDAEVLVTSVEKQNNQKPEGSGKIG